MENTGEIQRLEPQATEVIIEVNPLITQLNKSWGGTLLKAVDQLTDMGESGLDLVLSSLRSGDLKPEKALMLPILNTSNRVIGIKTFEALLKEPTIIDASKRTARARLLDGITILREPALIEPLLDFCGSRITAIKDISQDVDPEHMRMVYNYFYDIKDAFKAISNTPDRTAIVRADEIWEESEKLKEQLSAALKEQRESQAKIEIPPFLEEQDLTELPDVSLEDKKQIDKIIIKIDEDPYSLETQLAFSEIADKALPFVLDAATKGELNILYLKLPEKISDQNWNYIENYLLDNPCFSDLLSKSVFIDSLIEVKDEKAVRIAAEYFRLFLQNSSTNPEEANTGIRWGLYNLRRSELPIAQEFIRIFEGILPKIFIYTEENIPKIEKPSEKEKEAWKHDTLTIKGSALIAHMLGRGQEKVRDIDVFLTSDNFSQMSNGPQKVAYAENLENIENLLDPTEFQKLKDWIEKAGLTGRKINLVRMRTNQLITEQTFHNEPRLTLWDKDLEARFQQDEVNFRFLYEDYFSGNYIENQTIGKLNPNETLTRALRSLDLAERFGLEVEDWMLEDAEKRIKDGSFKISAVQQIGGGAMDAAFIKVFKDKNLRKLVLGKYPRLGQLADDIINAGGVDEFIKTVYGDIYLEMGSIKLYDVKLANSKATRHQQREFLRIWNERVRNNGEFGFLQLGERQGNPDLPVPDRLKDLTDQGSLENSEKDRASKKPILEQACGTYPLTVSSIDRGDIRTKIEAFLAINGLDWPSNVSMDHGKLSRTLIKLGVHPRNPMLADFDDSGSHEINLVLSGKSEDILQASTDKPWSSCMNLDGGMYHSSLYSDIGGGTCVAYLVDKDKKFIARSLVRPGTSLGMFEPAAAIETIYGDRRYDSAFRKALGELLKKSSIATGVPMITVPFKIGIYSDSSLDSLTSSDTTNLVYNTRRKRSY